MPYFEFSQCVLCALCVSVVNKVGKDSSQRHKGHGGLTEKLKLGHYRKLNDLFAVCCLLYAVYFDAPVAQLHRASAS